MQIAQSKTKSILVICLVNTAMFFTALFIAMFGVSLLSIYYPENMLLASFLITVFAGISGWINLYYYIKATKEDKLSEGL